MKIFMLTVIKHNLNIYPMYWSSFSIFCRVSQILCDTRQLERGCLIITCLGTHPLLTFSRMLINIHFLNKRNGLTYFAISNAKVLVSFLMPLGRAWGKSKWGVVVGCNWPDFEGPLLCACWFEADGWINHCCMVICLGLILLSLIWVSKYPTVIFFLKLFHFFYLQGQNKS